MNLTIGGSTGVEKTNKIVTKKSLQQTPFSLQERRREKADCNNKTWQVNQGLLLKPKAIDCVALMTSTTTY
ncbi:MAG: hypothetical protein VYE46_07225 [Cyanobacteriota bacterium]|nr:hypothetical protein [Cyanobacteriota bacterium]